MTAFTSVLGESIGNLLWIVWSRLKLSVVYFYSQWVWPQRVGRPCLREAEEAGYSVPDSWSLGHNSEVCPTCKYSVPESLTDLLSMLSPEAVPPVIPEDDYDALVEAESRVNNPWVAAVQAGNLTLL